MKIPFLNMFKSESSAPVMPVMENKITDAPPVMDAPPLPAAENFNAPPREYYRPSIAGDILEQQRADAVRKELRGEISLRRHEQNLRTAAARAEFEKSERERIARLEEFKNRPVTWEQKFQRVMDDGPSRSPKFIRHLIEAQGVQGKLDSTLKKIRAQLVEYEKLNTERRQLGGRAAASLFREKVLQQHADIRAGKEIGTITQLPHVEHMQTNFAQRRLLLREKLREIEAAVSPLLSDIGELLQNAARSRTEKLDELERTQAASLEIPFEPSVELRVTAAAGFMTKSQVEHEQLTPLIDTETFLFGLLAESK
jgi:hypothetical protein